MNRGILARAPLWIRLAAAMLLLVTVVLTAISTAGVSMLRGQLLDRTDAQLSTVAAGYDRSPVDALPPRRSTGGAASPNGTAFYRIEQRDADGRPVRPDSGSSRPAPASGLLAVPQDPAWLKEHEGRPLTLPAGAGNSSWRILVQPLAETSGWVVVAAGLGELDSTISRLTRITLAVGALGLAVLAVASVAIVRASLRPLARVERTAAAIAAGDLTQRIPDYPPRTELGRLGRALNAMLTQIEEGYQAQARSEAKARGSEERMRRFVSDAGHELRTPLSVIRAWTEYAQHGPDHDRAALRRMLDTVGAEAGRMGTLVEDLLLLARLDQQRPLEQHPVDVLALAIDAVRDARLLAPDRDIRLQADEQAEYVVTGDEDRLRQVLSNLTGNALAHTPPGTPVTIELGPGRLGEAAALTLDVTDRGPGLTPQQAKRVFERFYRADTSRTRSTGGSGLGLAIVASLVTAHAGTASVHSSPGAGATFRITLPLAEPPPAGPGAMPVGSSLEGGAGCDHAPGPLSFPVGPGFESDPPRRTRRTGQRTPTPPRPPRHGVDGALT
ncbi:HAMP domain-containing sensor histidine kinase [Streptomyces sp. NPDC051940]|uniref:sensor histidine kinase n=1 Tax=Streptomyces sp. NPDC051940 TaxID=3155675 RepID=UPI00342196EA